MARHAEDKSGQIETFDAIQTLLKSFKEQYTTHSKSQFLKYVQSILNTIPSNNCITITSIHCVKGLEADNVFVLNEGKAVVEGQMSNEQRQQEYNLSYVSLTRARHNLYLVKAEGEEY
jgi:superfamily I DNA/RNA helicase